MAASLADINTGLCRITLAALVTIITSFSFAPILRYGGLSARAPRKQCYAVRHDEPRRL